MERSQKPNDDFEKMKKCKVINDLPKETFGPFNYKQVGLSCKKAKSPTITNYHLSTLKSSSHIVIVILIIIPHHYCFPFTFVPSRLAL